MTYLPEQHNNTCHNIIFAYFISKLGQPRPAPNRGHLIGDRDAERKHCLCDPQPHFPLALLRAGPAPHHGILLLLIRPVHAWIETDILNI